MPDLFTILGSWKLTRGYLSALIRGEGGDFMAPGSENAMVTGQGLVRAFKGPRHLSTLQGSRVFFNTDQSYAGLGSATTPGTILTSALSDGGNSYAVGDTGTVDTGDANAAYEILTVDGFGAVLTYGLTNAGTGYAVRENAGTTSDGAQPGAGVGFTVDILTVSGAGRGSVFKVQDLLCYIGDGQVAFDGAHLTGVIASSTLSLVKKSGGVYAVGPLTGPFQAGHVQPPPPEIFLKSPASAGQVTMNSTIAIVVWRVSSITGQVSLMSEPSNVLAVVNGSVIVSIPELPDTNGQDIWGVGVPKIGFADLGWFYELPISRGGEVADADLVTIDGHPRALEISWTNGHLLGQNTAPDKALPPPPGDFAGAMNDVAWLDADGIIYVSEPGFIGSMPPSNALFASEAAVLYLKINDGLTARLGKTSIGTLYYVGGSPALEYQTIIENQGIEFAQNACVGFNGRVLAFMGKPTVIDNNAEPDLSYSRDVAPEFEGWESQTAAMPVVAGYDGLGKYECWAWQTKIMAKFAPDDAWCAPINLTIGDGDNEVIGNVIAAVTYRNKLYLCCSDGAELAVYQFDAGTGSVMKIQTSDESLMGYFCNLTQIMVEGRADNIEHPVRVEIVRNYDDDNPISDTLSDFVATPTGVGTQNFCPRQPNILDINQHAVKVTLTSQGGDAGINKIKTFGPKWEVLNHQCAAGTLPQVINFEPIEGKFTCAADFLVSATSNSGLLVTFTASGNCEVEDHGDGTATVHLTGDEGACSVTAHQAGNTVYDPAPEVEQSFIAFKESQTITFPAISSKGSADAPFAISATASSGLIPSFAASGECSLVDHGDGTATVTLTGNVGNCAITASQVGDGCFEAAEDVDREFTVTLSPLTFIAGTCGSLPTILVEDDDPNTMLLTYDVDEGGSQGGLSVQYLENDGEVWIDWISLGNLFRPGIGLSEAQGLDCNWETIDYSWHAAVGGGGIPVQVREEGSSFGASLPLAGVFKIKVVAGVVRYYRNTVDLSVLNDVLIYTSLVSAAGKQLHLDIESMTQSGGVSDVIRVYTIGFIFP